MFKYVESMRKAAFRIMARTFGTKRKDSGESVYDQYALRDLVRLLGFEDLDEAREACRHYNITVKEMSIAEGSNETIDIIFWRNTDFREPKDPSKGHILSLIPRKMNRVIESKLGGSTRLAICRGEVSGVGATLDASISPQDAQHLDELRKKREENRLKRQQAIEEARGNEDKMRLRMEQIRQAKEKKAHEERMGQEMIAKERAAQEAARRMEAEALVQKRNIQEAARREEEARQRAQEAAIEEARSRKEEAERQRIEQLEAERRRLKSEEEERQRQIEFKQAQEEIARKERLTREAEEKLRREKEAELQHLLMIERKRQEELERQRKAKEDEERRIELEWQAKIDFARKFVTLKRWSARASAIRDKREGTKATIEAFNPLSTSTHTFQSTIQQKDAGDRIDAHEIVPYTGSAKVSYADVFYQLGTDMTAAIDLHELLFDALAENRSWRSVNQMKLTARLSKNVVLFKLGIVLIEGSQNKDLNNMMKMWIDSRLHLGHVQSASNNDAEVRTVTAIYHCTAAAFRECDAVLLIVPPSVDVNIDRYVSSVDVPYHTFAIDDMPEPSAEDFDRALFAGCSRLVHNASLSIFEPSTSGLLMLETFSLRQLCCTVLRRTLCSFENDIASINRLPSHLQRTSLETHAARMVIHCAEVLIYLLENMHSLSNSSVWPAGEFVCDSEVPSYFSNGDGLPVQWRDTSEITRLQEAMWDIFPSMKKDDPSLIEFLHDILDDAASEIQQTCGALLNENKLSECLAVGLQWHEHETQVRFNEYYVYLPVGGASTLIDYYLEETLTPKTIVAEKIEPPVPVLADQENMEPLLITDGNDDQLIEKEDESHIDEVLPTQLPFSSPQVTNKRPMMTITNDDTSSDRKRSKVAAMLQRNGISNDLQRSMNFTTNLKALCDDHETSMNRIMNDPILAKLIQSDENLKKLMQM